MNENMIVITYYNTLHDRNESMNVFGGIRFEKGYAGMFALFASGGRGYAIPAEHIVKIEAKEG